MSLIATDETRMTPKTKVLLSLKYRRPDALRQILNKQGIEFVSKLDPSTDPRPMHYVLFHDLAEEFGLLLGHGYNGKTGTNIEVLIMA